MNELNILKKHLGDVSDVSAFEAKQICSQINDANDFIGALQVLDINLKKIHKNISERVSDENLDDIQKRTLDANTSQLIQNCAFMGAALYDNIFKVYVGKQLFEFEISNPLLVLEKSNYEGVLAYIEDKREEISGILVDLATAITLGTSFDTNMAFDSKQDFTNLFR